MRKQIIKRFLIGFATGVFVGETILILTSVFAGNGTFSPVSPYLVRNAGSDLAAVIIQYLCTGIMGATFASSSIIFELDNWSLLKQTVVHFLSTSILMYIVGFFCGWFPHNVSSTLLWFGVFIVVYLIFWISFIMYYKKKTREINEKLKQK